MIFRSQLADPGTITRLEQLGFSTAHEHEPLMICPRPPAPTAGLFRVRRAVEDEIDCGIAISSEAHEVDRDMLERTLARTPRDVIELWLAWDGAEPISAVWLLRGDGVIGVWSMMTPRRHQRRGAGRALLTAALAYTWSPDTRFAVLIATPGWSPALRIDRLRLSRRGDDELPRRRRGAARCDRTGRPAELSRYGGRGRTFESCRAHRSTKLCSLGCSRVRPGRG